MAKRVVLIILGMLLICASPLMGQRISNISPAGSEKRGLKVQPVKHYLWELNHPSFDYPAYIFGYLYQVPQDHFFLPPELDQVVRRADRLVMEVDPLLNGTDYLLRGSVPFDSTLEALLPRREYQQLLDLVRDSLSQRSLQKLAERYPPAYLLRQFLCDYCLGGPFGNHKVVSYEEYLRQAITLPLETLGTDWTRTSLYEKYSITDQLGIMQETLDGRTALCRIYNRMMIAYRKGDLDEVWLLAQSVPDLGHNGGLYIEARNNNWIPQIMNLMRYESLIIAVHAQQLPGEYGLLHQFRKRGFEVRAIF